MVIGKTYGARYGRAQEKLKKLKGGKTWFAWYPVQENRGRRVWLERVWIYYGIYEHEGRLYLPNEKPMYRLRG